MLFRGDGYYYQQMNEEFSRLKLPPPEPRAIQIAGAESLRKKESDLKTFEKQVIPAPPDLVLFRSVDAQLRMQRDYVDRLMKTRRKGPEDSIADIEEEVELTSLEKGFIRRFPDNRRYHAGTWNIARARMIGCITEEWSDEFHSSMIECTSRWKEMLPKKASVIDKISKLSDAQRRDEAKTATITIRDVNSDDKTTHRAEYVARDKEWRSPDQLTVWKEELVVKVHPCKFCGGPAHCCK